MSQSSKNDPNLSKKRLTQEQTDERERFVEFLLKKCETATEPLDLPAAANEFKSLNDTSTTVHVLLRSMRLYRKQIQQLTDLEPNTLARQMFGLGMKANPLLIARLKKEAYVEWRGRKQTMSKYVANDGSLHLEVLPKPKPAMKGVEKRSQVKHGNEEMDREEEMEEEDSSDDELDDPVPQVAKKRKTDTPRYSEVQVKSQVCGPRNSTKDSPKSSQNARRAETTAQAQLPGSNTSIKNQKTRANPAGEVPNSLDEPVEPMSNDKNEVGNQAKQKVIEQNATPNKKFNTKNDKEKPVVKQENVDEAAQTLSTGSNPSANKNQKVQVKHSHGVEANIQHEQKFVPELPIARTVTLATHKKLLRSLSTLAEVMELPMDSRRLNSTVRLIENCETLGSHNGPEFKKLEIDDLSCALHYSVIKLKQCYEVKQSTNARSLQRYLTLLQFIIADSGIGELEKMKQQLKEEIRKIEGRDKLVAVSGISTSLDVILDILNAK